MLFQIDIKLSFITSWYCNQFESNVILDRYKTLVLKIVERQRFESNVILDRYKTIFNLIPANTPFESNVILDRYKTSVVDFLM